MSKLRQAYAETVKSHPCIVCGKVGVDMAHLMGASKLLGFKKPPRTWGNRTHKGYGWYVAVPLCRECHDKVHMYGEQWLHEQLPGEGLPYAIALRLLLETLDDQGVSV